MPTPSKIFFIKKFPQSAIYDSSKCKVLKMVKSKNRHHVYYFSFLQLETLLLGDKRILHSKGPKNVLRLFSGKRQNIAPGFLQCFVWTLTKRQSTFLGPLE